MVKIKEHIIPLLSCITVLFLSLLVASLKNHISFTSVLSEFVNNLYLPKKNLFEVKTVAGMNTYIYFYMSLAGSALITFLTNTLLTKKSPFYTQSLFFHATLALFITAFGLQTIANFSYFKGELRTFHNKSVSERISIFFPNSYRFAQYCKTYLPGKHYGKPITDIDITRTQAMLTFLGVAYYLYPIDIRIDKVKPKDCLIVFIKENPLDAVLNDFVAMDPYDSSSLIAIKKKP